MSMTYLGGKEGAGVYQRIINLMPPHAVYIEPFLGGGAIMRHKRPARVNIGIDRDAAVVDAFRTARTGRIDDGSSSNASLVSDPDRHRYDIRVGNALTFLADYPFTGDECVYCDPPYVRSTRRSQRDLYRYEMSDDEHRALLDQLLALPCPVLVSGYRSRLYETYLKDWNTIEFKTMTRGGQLATERVWFNFAPPKRLHDGRYVGRDFRERERYTRQRKRWIARLQRMPTVVRESVIDAINETFKDRHSDRADAVTETNAGASRTQKLILSVFPGIDLLGRAFEEHDFCVVRGPDTLWGGDIRKFHPPRRVFDGLIGGPPCQDFSLLNRQPADYSKEMLSEYERVVREADVRWFLYENVVQAPSPVIEGYETQRFALDLAWFSPFSRRRDFVFGAKDGQLLNPMVGVRRDIEGNCVTSTDSRSFEACCEIQGLSKTFDLPGFTLNEKKHAIANAVPMQLGRYLAKLIGKTVYGTTNAVDHTSKHRRCLCHCGRVVVGKAHYASVACRKRAQRQRDSDRRRSLRQRA